MDGLEKIKIYAQMLLEVINEEEKRKYEEKKNAAAEKERQMLIDLSGISINAKPRADRPVRHAGQHGRFDDVLLDRPSGQDGVCRTLAEGEA